METVATGVSTGVVVPTHSALNWSAIFAGWFVASAIAAMLYVGGLALGFSAFDPYEAAATARGISAGAAIWMILTWAAALFLGGMFASWYDSRNDTEMGVIRGLAIWGVSVTATGLLIASGLTHVMYVGTAATAPAAGVDANLVAHYTAMSMWIAFLCMLLGLVTSALGGWLGARHISHVYHQRTYQTRV